jgi:KDO2-lipid IV(A) lauroyltransferase
MSMGTARRWGARVGRLAHAADAFHRDIARENLAHAFPSRSDAERRALTRDMFEHFGSLLFELMKMGTLSQSDLLQLVDFEGDERVAHAYAQGRGVLFFTGHFGTGR